MNRCVLHLIDFYLAIAFGRPWDFAQIVQAAFEAGAARADLQAVVAKAKWTLPSLPTSVLTQAEAAILARCISDRRTDLRDRQESSPV